MCFFTVESISQGFALDLTSLITVELASSVLNIVFDSLVLGLTWVKTAGIRKAFSELGVQTSITTLLLRDGECVLFDLAGHLNNDF